MKWVWNLVAAGEVAIVPGDDGVLVAFLMARWWLARTVPPLLKGFE
jgi:hypothetical protein